MKNTSVVDYELLCESIRKVFEGSSPEKNMVHCSYVENVYDLVDVYSRTIEFVCFVLKNKELLIKKEFNSKGGVSYASTKKVFYYFKCVQWMAPLAQSLSNNYRFDEFYESFRRACSSPGLQMCLGEIWSIVSQKGRFFDSPFSERCVDEFLQLVERIRIDCKENNVVYKKKERVREAERRFSEYKDYVNSLYLAYGRLVVLRVDLYYRDDLRLSLGINELSSDLERFLAMKRRRPEFNGLVGYIAKLEHGFKRGAHAHLLFFFDGDLRRGASHVYFAQQLGELWMCEATQGRGRYWNVNANVADFERKRLCAVGLISKHDEKARSNLVDRVLKYICKSDQYITIPDHKVRLLRHGKRPQLKAGQSTMRAWQLSMLKLNKSVYL